jgi:starch synthase
MPTTLKVLFLASEADPLIKVGGLGDVAGSLPAALRRLSRTGDGLVDVRLAIPLHGGIARERYALKLAARFKVYHENGPIPGEAWETEINGVPVYLISGWPIRQDAPVYTTETRADGFKFTYFSLAALEMARNIGWKPDILHANDWHTAMAVYAISLRRGRDSFYADTATLLGLHNLPYLGAGAGRSMNSFSLPPALNTALPWWAQNMPLPVGLLTADALVAVSPQYAREILTEEFGSGLQDFLQTRRESISGILNGLDVERADPSRDPAIFAPFSAEKLSERAANKTGLQRQLGWKASRRTPLIGMIGRMDTQKGFDLAMEALRNLATSPLQANQPWQAVILGTGDPVLEAEAQRLQYDFPGRVRAAIRFDAALSRKIYAGADILLMPSRYEPCGLAQMMAMRYGCVPVARATGGLVDTILDHDSQPGATGFLFQAARSEDLQEALQRAFLAYSAPQIWRDIQRNGMRQDFSWDRSAKEYLALYIRLAATRQPQYRR